MKLTKEQIQQIEYYLNKKKVKYIDIRFEILDHIISDVEFIIKNNNSSFEDAFSEVKLKWNKSLKNSSSFLLGIANEGPSILINKCLKIYKPFFYKSIVLIIIVSAVFYSVNKSFNYSLANYKESISFVISIALSFYIVLGVYGYIKMKIKKVNSTYSFLYYKQIFPNLMLAIFQLPLIHVDYLNKENELSSFMFAMLFLLFIITLAGSYLYKKHLKVVSQYKPIQIK